MSRSFSSGFRHGLGRAAAVVGLVATVVFVSAPAMASAATVPLVGSTFSISSPGSLSGTSGQAITPVQFVASNVDASTAPATTSITWVAGQLPAGLALSATGQLSGTLNASIPGGVYDVRVVATEKVVTKWRGRRIVAYAAADFATRISIAGPSVTVSDQTVIGSGFDTPSGVAVGSSGHVFVADTGNSRVVKMDVDGSNRTVIGSGFAGPYGVAVDSSGHVFVADTDNSRVVKMDADGSNQTAFESGFFYPYGVGADSSGHVFVAGNGRVVTLDARIPDQTIPSVEAGQPLVATQLVGGAVDPSTPPRVTSVKWFASSLPAGLRLSSSGVLSGTPLAALDAGRYSIYVVATQRVTTKIGTVTSVTTKTTSRVIQIVIT